MLPGQAYTPVDLFRMVWRRKWLIALPAVVTAALAYAYGSSLRDQYQSETLILVVPQRVPETFVRSTVTMRIEDRMRTIAQQILSRPRLEQLITEMDLYPEERQVRPLDDVIVGMRASVETTIVRGDSIRLAFTYSDPEKTKQVTERLASDVIQDNVRDRQAQAEGTNQFLEAQLEDARSRLITQEKRLEGYRRAHAGELPTQLQSNLQVIQSLQLQLQGLQDSINRDRDRRVVVERLIAELETVAVAAPTPAPAPAALAQLPVEHQLDVARQELAVLQGRGLTSAHPDVRAAQRKVEELEERAKRELGNRPTSTGPAVATVSPAEAGRRNQLATLAAERENLDRQIGEKTAEDGRLRASINEYQARIESVPTRESELIELTRDYDTLQAAYRGLLAKKEESQIATNLESRQIGEQFRMIEPARVPEQPISPNRLVINAAGVAAGLLFGLVLAALLEVRDVSLKNEDDILAVLELPVLALVPVVQTDADRRKQRMSRIFKTAGVVGALALAIGGAIAWRGGL